MKGILAVPVVFLLAGCAATPTGLTAIGARDATGARVGEYRFVSGPNLTVAQGRFAHGKLDGTWRYFDSRKVKIAELTYRDGTLSGHYQTYFGSIVHPEAAGKLESDGRMENGRVVGRHIGYEPSGRVFTDAVFGASGVERVAIGTREQAEQTAASDERFAQSEEGLVRSALPQR